MKTKAALISKPNKISLKEIDIPNINPDEVLVKVKSVGVCGTDLHIFKGKYDSVNKLFFNKGKYFIPGHEWSGETIKVGKNVSGINIGDKVVSEVILYCGNCKSCEKNKHNLCLNAQKLGITRFGAFSEYMVIPSKIIYKIPDNISFDLASLIEPLTVVLHAIDKTNIENDDCVAILGDGPIGLIALKVILYHYKINKVIITGTEDKRLKLAEKIAKNSNRKITTIKVNLKKPLENINKILKLTGGVDVVIEAAGNINAFKETLKITKHGARIVILSNFGGDKVLIDPNTIMFKELEIKGSLSGSGRRYWEKAIELLSHPNFMIDDIITHKFKFSDIKKALKVANNKKESIKIILNW